MNKLMYEPWIEKGMTELEYFKDLYLQERIRVHVDHDCSWRERHALLKEALQKIDDPVKYYHWEKDSYTRAACFQFVAQESLNKDEELGRE